jgi:hypothetical protein
MASSHQITSLLSEIDFGKGIHLLGEIGVSHQDLNLYSEKNDQDNLDGAYRSQLRLENQNLNVLGKSLGTIELDAQLRSIGENFRPISRMTEVEHGRKWGTEEGRIWGEEMEEVHISYKPVSTWLIDGEFGSLRRENDFRSSRNQFMTDFNIPRMPKIHYQIEKIDTREREEYSGYWLRQTGRISGAYSGFIPSVHYLGEHRKDKHVESLTGFRYDEWRGQLAYSKGQLRFTVGETYRNDRRYSTGVLKKHSFARTDFIQIQTRMKNGLSTSIMFTHRNRAYDDPSIQDQRTHLADLKIRFLPSKRVVDANLNYRFSSNQISQLLRDTLSVDQGLGNFRYDEQLNELVPDPDGNLLIRLIQTGEFLPVNELRVGGDIRFEGKQIWKKPHGIANIFKMLRTRSLMRVERRDRDQSFFEVNRSAFTPDWGMDSSVVMARINLLQDIEMVSRLKGWSMRIRIKEDNSENHQLLGEGFVRELSGQEFRFKAKPYSRVGSLIEYQHKTESKRFDSPYRVNRDIDLHSVSIDLSYRPKQRIEFGFKGRVRTANDNEIAVENRVFSISCFPRFGYSFKGKGHLRTELEWSNVSSNPEDRVLPYEMLGGDQPGRTIRWNVLLSYRISGHIMSTFTYRGRREPWRDDVFQSGQVEVRAFF